MWGKMGRNATFAHIWGVLRCSPCLKTPKGFPPSCTSLWERKRPTLRWGKNLGPRRPGLAPAQSFRRLLPGRVLQEPVHDHRAGRDARQKDDRGGDDGRNCHPASPPPWRLHLHRFWIQFTHRKPPFTEAHSSYHWRIATARQKL